MREAIEYYIKMIISFFIRGLFLIPVKENRILFISFLGKQYSCNPKYITEYLQSHYNGMFDIIWAVNNINDFSHLKEMDIKFIKYKSIIYFYYRLFSKVLITNVGEYPYIPVRKKQLFINTWHGGGAYKKVGMQNAEKCKSRYYVKLMKMSYEQTNLFLSSSRAFSELTLRQSMHYQGKILEAGMPRNDLLFGSSQNKISKRVKKHFNIGEQDKVCIFAPTYRENREAEDFGLNFDELKRALSERFGGEWYVLYRSHQFLNNKEIKHNVISASGYPDMQELLCTADVLISDYSSSIWDFSFTYRPIFLFVPDLKEYVSERDFYEPIEEWGFPYAKSNKELKCRIKGFNIESFQNAMDRHHKKLGSYESGHATEVVCKKIMEVCMENK